MDAGCVSRHRLVMFRVKHRAWSFVAVWWRTLVSIWLSHSVQTLYRYHSCCFCEGVFKMRIITSIRGLSKAAGSLQQSEFPLLSCISRKIKEEGILLPDGLCWTWSATSALPLLSNLPCRFCTQWAPQSGEPMRARDLSPTGRWVAD